MWEITSRNAEAGWTMWQGRDAEGRTVYAVTSDRAGVAVEPRSGGLASKRAALELHRFYSDAGREGGAAVSDAKATAARANGTKGGRPRKT